MVIGGLVAIVVGLSIKQIRKIFPPLVIGTVIFAIGLSLYTTAINYMAGNPSNTYEVIVEEQGQTAALVFLSLIHIFGYFSLPVRSVRLW